MERSTPVRKSHTSTADLLVWKENQQEDAANAGDGPRPVVRSNQPSDGISKVLSGGQVSEEEAQSLLKRKPCSGPKLKEMTGSGIFAPNSEDGAEESVDGFSTPNGRPGLKLYQQASIAISQISFSAEENLSPKKPVSAAEVAKQRELSGNLDIESESSIKKQLSDAKCKELSGHDIFGPPPEITPRHLAARLERKDNRVSEDIEILPRSSIHTSVKVSNPSGGPSNLIFSEEPVVAKTAKKIHDQKFAQLSGNGIFSEDEGPGSVEKPLSVAKLREISGSDIFADGKVAPRDYLGGVRKPPGGESSIALV